MVSGGPNYVQVLIDIEGEKIKLDHAADVNIRDITDQLHMSEPRFHFFAYPHLWEGRQITSYGKEEKKPTLNSDLFESLLNILVYIYSCPDGSGGTKGAPVKMRMLYSSSKAAVAEILTQAGVKADV